VVQLGPSLRRDDMILGSHAAPRPLARSAQCLVVPRAVDHHPVIYAELSIRSDRLDGVERIIERAVWGPPC
jgi:hypothetical protein